MKSMKRSIRRHHEERIKAKCVRHVRNQTHADFFQGKWVWKYDDSGKLISRYNILIPDWREKFDEHIRVRTYRDAHHRPHFCQMCRRPRYDRKKDGLNIEDE